MLLGLLTAAWLTLWYRLRFPGMCGMMWKTDAQCRDKVGNDSLIPALLYHNAPVWQVWPREPAPESGIDYTQWLCLDVSF